ncbi:MAG TPA: vWA domain-containing protein [Hyphomicrobiaceae bacterium]|nr:vWA domain-containing protein [Hyphomicrobiaceae bacterium]
MIRKVHTCIVLDRSGSMEDCRTDAIGAVNSFLRQTKDDTTSDNRISLIIFDSQSIDVIRDRVPAAVCKDLQPGEYEPRAGTPLLDAVGHGASVLSKSAEKEERCVLAVMTDGHENSSREYTYGTLKALLERRQKEDGWLVVYLGAGHDSWAQADKLGFARGNVASFDKRSLHATSVELKKRRQRYVDAGDHVLEARFGGFTDEERAAMQGGDDRKGA